MDKQESWAYVKIVIRRTITKCTESPSNIYIFWGIFFFTVGDHAVDFTSGHNVHHVISTTFEHKMKHVEQQRVLPTPDCMLRAEYADLLYSSRASCAIGTTNSKYETLSGRFWWLLPGFLAPPPGRAH